MDERYTKEEIIAACYETLTEMHKEYHGIMTSGDLQSIVQFIQLLELKFIE